MAAEEVGVVAAAPHDPVVLALRLVGAVGAVVCAIADVPGGHAAVARETAELVAGARGTDLHDVVAAVDLVGEVAAVVLAVAVEGERDRPAVVADKVNSVRGRRFGPRDDVGRFGHCGNERRHWRIESRYTRKRKSVSDRSWIARIVATWSNICLLTLGLVPPVRAVPDPVAPLSGTVRAAVTAVVPLLGGTVRERGRGWRDRGTRGAVVLVLAVGAVLAEVAALLLADGGDAVVTEQSAVGPTSRGTGEVARREAGVREGRGRCRQRVWRVGVRLHGR